MIPLDIALTLALRGLPVFPCGRNKQPCIPKAAGGTGLNDATRDPAIIRRLFAHHHAMLVGVPTGEASGFDVLDLDYRHGAAAWEQVNVHRLPETRTHATPSGGRHLLFHHAPGVRNSASRIAAGIDVRGAGGYVIFPPSAGYSVIASAGLAYWPDWLLPQALPPPEPLRSDPLIKPCGPPMSSARLDAIVQSALGRIRSAADGAKHFTLRNMALLLGGIAGQAGFTDDTAARWLLDSLPGNVRDWRGAEQTAVWGLQQGRASPIDLPEHTERRPDRRRKATARAAFNLLRLGVASAELLAALHDQNNQRLDPLPAGVIDETAIWAARQATEHAHAR